MFPRFLRRLALAGLAISWLAVAPALQRVVPEDPDDARVRQAWSYLTPQEQHDAVQWLSVELESQETLQLVFLRHALSLYEDDPGTLPQALEIEWFDPSVHAPADPIARRPLEADDAKARRAREQYLVDLGPPRSAWAYHWGRGRVERTGSPDDPELLFENALAGYPPGADLAQAFVVSILDDGSLRAAHAAFAHAYTDRSGRVYPGVTLYDAWASGSEMEMPDVDTLGVVHTVLDEWKKWKAPVSTSKQKKLYAAVGEIFVDVQRQRGLCEAFARTYLAPAPALADGYSASLDTLHNVWDEHDSEPRSLASELPASKAWKRFLADAAKRAGKTAAAEAAATRRATLERDEWHVRSELVRVLAGLSAFERDRRPAPPETDSPAPPGKR